MLAKANTLKHARQWLMRQEELMIIVKNINPAGCCAWAAQRHSTTTPESAQIPMTARDLGKRLDYEQALPPLAARPYEPASAVTE